jgi:hypothetical protein
VKKAPNIIQKERKDRKVTEGSRGNFTEGKFAKQELRWEIKTTSYGTSLWRRNVAIENIITIRPMP